MWLQRFLRNACVRHSDRLFLSRFIGSLLLLASFASEFLVAQKVKTLKEDASKPQKVDISESNLDPTYETDSNDSLSDFEKPQNVVHSRKQREAKIRQERDDTNRENESNFEYETDAETATNHDHNVSKNVSRKKQRDDDSTQEYETDGSASTATESGVELDKKSATRDKARNKRETNNSSRNSNQDSSNRSNSSKEEDSVGIESNSFSPCSFSSR